MTFKFNSSIGFVKIHVRAKIHQSKCSGSIISYRVHRKTKNAQLKTILPLLSRTVVT